jgi:hypothetical protein
MSFEEAFDLMGQDEAFRATVYAMNTLLIAKGFYSAEEFQELFIEHAVNFKNGFEGKTTRTISGTSPATVPANL